MATARFARDSRILGLVGAGHFISHFYLLSLPPLLILWRQEFGASYAALGLVVSMFSVATGVAQIPAGMLVDRVGARGVLFAGLLIEGCAIGAMALAPGLETLLVLALVAGAANSVFHPADYSILNSSVSSDRMGRAFSLHTFAGHMGSAVAPVTILSLAAVADWRFALGVVGAVGVVMAFLIVSQSAVLNDDRAPPPEKSPTAPARIGSLRLFLSRPLMLFFLFFVLTSMTTSGVLTFSVVAAMDLHGISLGMAGAALTGFLFASAAGVLIGGVMADRTGRHDRVAAAAFVATALIFALVGAVSLSALAMIALFALAGVLQGIIRPARDMMVRAVAPKGTSGRVFAFVSTGLAVGGAVAPVMFGWIVDQGGSRWVFWLLAGFMLAATLTLVRRQRSA